MVMSIWQMPKLRLSEAQGRMVVDTGVTVGNPGI